MRIASPFGVDLRLHPMFLLYVGLLGAFAWNGEGLSAATTMLAHLATLFACVTLHEFGHVLAARRLGIGTRHVTLYPFGGIAALEDMPHSARGETFVALAGPAVNVALAAAAWAAGGRLPWEATGAVPLADSFLAINFGLAAFNMVPAFPMDGGRVLRALLSTVVGRPAATAVASVLGQVAAVGFAVLGWYADAPMLILIGVFIFMAAAAEGGRHPLWMLGFGRKRTRTDHALRSGEA